MIRLSALIGTFNHDYSDVIMSNAASYVHNRRTFDSGIDRNYFEFVNFRGQKALINVNVQNMIRDRISEHLKCRLIAIFSSRKPFVTSRKTLLFPTKPCWYSLCRPRRLFKTSEENVDRGACKRKIFLKIEVKITITAWRAFSKSSRLSNIRLALDV